ncbi:23S rRNA (uracil(1939)-C(5))-methyltransferase RlmD [Hydrogenovibrio sp. SC-1]|uniref:23S rRNA (uracil(1939)-C(5))-methyltransferase RlmD n=1 Tax=Hydrogenovibrio sp. SC-1 TaxID=2065820 RepID=UPI000C796278|nr:23S rRNA (uracil(1939)-C(5))-methyltransferase RlmD [Hydrogenovibrio sp. SC-1]PLA74649.1 23S rRNA (uracil(1939)-C(5))-methyltransferase RlmD [Hydrogenovibrio sp. SC-1]
MTKTPISITIEGLSQEGRGVGRHHGKTVFVMGAVPGDQVLVKVVAQHNRYDEAEIIMLEQASPDRREPLCHYDSECGGCQLLQLKPEAQRHWKWQQFQTDLSKAVDIKHCQLEAPIYGEEEGYRRRARLVLGRNKSDKLPKLGFRAKGSNEIVDIEQCPMLTSALNQSLVDKRQQQLAAASRSLKELTVVEADNGIFWSDQQPEVLPCYQLGDLTLNFPVTGFVQVNADINQQMVNQALAWLALSPSHQVLDAFCGVGNFSLAIAQQLHDQQGKVIGIEGDADLVKMAQQNATTNKLDNAHFYKADLFQPVIDLAWFRKQKYDSVLLDPGRQGAFALCKVLGKLKPERIVYVSCNTATLIRDLKALTEQGYRLKKATLLDMFPNTAHTEAMVLLVKSAKPANKRKIGVFKL